MLQLQNTGYGFIGLGRMGQNAVRNLLAQGQRVVVYNRTHEKIDQMVQEGAVGAHSVAELASLLARPRVVWLMVAAGQAVDDMLFAPDGLAEHLSPGDVIIEGGNSFYRDSMRRAARLAERRIHMLDCGSSGGLEGARNGMCLMVGGDREAFELAEPLFHLLATEDGYAHVGPSGAGHFVKMVHNGIEYGDMQLIGEAYHLMRSALGMSADEMHAVFAEWNRGKLDSYLIEITRDILAYKDSDGQPLVDRILDAAGQKGTGKWTVIAALDTGIPLTLISEAVFARCLSALKEERVRASQILSGPTALYDGQREALVNDIREALYASKIISYTQGYMLMRAAAEEYHWNLNYGGIALMWRGGCIIRSVFLGKIKEAFDADPNLTNLLLAPYFKEAVESAQSAWRRVVAIAVGLGIPVPAMSSALAFYDGYRQARLPANLLQAQRDYFGAHTYERVDRPRGEFFHTDWTGRGGSVTATTYTV